MKKISTSRHLSQSVEYKSFQKIRMVGILGFFVVVLAILLSLWFIYTHIYQTLDRAQQLMVLKSDPQFEPVDFKLYDDVNLNWSEKNGLVIDQEFKNPFGQEQELESLTNILPMQANNQL